MFTSTVDNLGPTVEWYVAYVFNRKHWQATTNVLLEDNKDGDFDVLAVLSSEIAYVECKTSAPDQIPYDDLVTFLNRRDFLEPAFALLLVDTTSSSVQELANRLDDAFWKRQHSSGEVRPVTRVRAIDSSESVFANGTTIYVGNANAGAANGLLRTLQLTLRHYSTRVRGNMVLAGE